MAEAKVLGVIITRVSDPVVYRGACRLCSWATHPGGTTHELALTAIRAHVEAAHNATITTIAKASERP